MQVKVLEVRNDGVLVDASGLFRVETSERILDEFLDEQSAMEMVDCYNTGNPQIRARAVSYSIPSQAATQYP